MSPATVTTVYDIASALPDIETLRHRCRALAILEVIISPEWESRYYSFDAAWNTGEQMASMRNGSGDEYSIVFTAAGAFIRGFDHESPMSRFGNGGELWPGLLDGVPDVFASQVAEPAFSYAGKLSATFCLWRQSEDAGWRTGRLDFPAVRGYRDDPDGSGLLKILCDGSGDAYRAFATDYYEVEIDQAAVTHIYARLPLDDHIVRLLNPDLVLADVADEVTAMEETRRA
ncbi:hypothetical protein [Catellatospora paridis]|uniref:hypothetical protein n=1 Tax=Catellatospora paridis TaxID=1617086 RepID=UPI0012D3B1D3|nr:hypothetical protein [Catellatospora paridis]